MERQFIGTATSVSKHKNYDALDTLHFCIEHSIGTIQVYLNNFVLTNKNNIHDISTLALKHDIQVTCHFPESLNNACLSDTLCTAAQELLAYQQEKKIILHFDEYEQLKKSLQYITCLNERGFSVCVENYCQKKDEKYFLQTIKKYLSLLVQSKKRYLSVTPVLDLPRLFINDIFTNFNSLFLSKQICGYIENLSLSTILHLVDFNDYSQERKYWCAFGNGLMPYKSIFTFIKEKKMVLDHIVFEFEDKAMVLKSIKTLHDMI